MADRGDRRFPSWKWIAVLAVSAVGTLVLMAFGDVRKDISSLQDKKADRAELTSMMERQRSMDDKLDFIIRMHIDDKGDIITLRR